MSTFAGSTLVVPLLVTFPRGAELIIILLIVLLLFGARKLPDLANSVGRSIREFRKGAEGAFDDDEVEKDDAAAPDRDAER
jgi:sec-independent protein translocase protein TatA